jgi:hypothetical protein
MMPRSLTLVALGLLLMGSSAAAQNSSDAPDEMAEIGRRLRSFYFNLAHSDWEALTADILPAKVVAHRLPPESLIRDESRAAPALPLRASACSAGEPVSTGNAVIRLQGDWAEAIVPHCAPEVGRDEFRLIWFGGRWRFVSIQLFRQPVSVTVGR